MTVLKQKDEVEAVEVAEAARTSPEITPDILVILAAAVASFLGHGARIRSAREIVNPWARQGRALTHASRNLQPSAAARQWRRE
ncbi:MAG TPA: hypothetical protein VJ572_11075 [Azonexus sp.]|nr:hypothetical protein [Azonexus sp.]